VSLQHPLLAAHAHGFGLRDVPAPRGLLRPKQVHGRVVVSAEACRQAPPPEADAVLSIEPGVPVGVVTADCVPVLLAAASGGVVAAAHAGWRGLAQGILAQSVDAMRRKTREELVAVIGPHIGPCCYEVDAPVLDPLREVFGPALDGAVTSGRPAHAQLDLGQLARHALRDAGLSASHIGELRAVCTHCDAERFHSYRRDGARAGRLVHHIAARKP
jgi:YfiH family protein